MQYVTKYSTEGIMTLEQFIRFLDDHMIKKPGSEKKSSMFNEIEEIHQLYLDIKLNKATCRRCVTPFAFLRRWNDEKSRLKKALNPDLTSKNASTAKIATNLGKLYSQIKGQLNFLAKCYVTKSIYYASIA